MYAYFENREDSFLATITHKLSFPLHLHPHLEFFLALSGTTEVCVRGQSCTLSAGDLTVIFPNQIHSYLALSGDAQALLAICDLSYTGGYVDTLLRYHPSDPFLSSNALHANVSYAIHEMAAEQAADNSRSVYVPLVQLVLARTLPLFSLHRNRGTDYRELTYQIAHYVGESFQDSLTLESLARKLGVNRFHLSHVFSEKIGQSFPTYLANVRLAYACSMLTGTDHSVTEVAEESGFGSQRTFFRAFRQRYGMTPAMYRRGFKKAELT